MEVLVFGFAVVFGFGSYFFFNLKNKPDGAEKNYYYKRFVRNRAQLLNYIEQFEQIISKHHCDEELVNNGLSVQNYLLQIKSELEENYSDSTLKMLKKAKFKFKHKKTYSKLLIDQGEKLYNIEKDLAVLHTKYTD